MRRGKHANHARASECEECHGLGTYPIFGLTCIHCNGTWAENHLDQFEHVVFQSKFGPIYLSLTMETPWPNSFEPYPLVQQKPAAD